MCVYVLSSLAFAPGGLLLRPTVYVHSGDQPLLSDINSARTDTAAMCECSLTVNISLAVSCPPCQHSHFKKGAVSDRFSRGRFNVPASECSPSGIMSYMKRGREVEKLKENGAVL